MEDTEDRRIKMAKNSLIFILLRSGLCHPSPETGGSIAALTEQGRIIKVMLGQFPFLALRYSVQFSSFQFSRSVVSDSLRPHESQNTRPPCPSPTPGVHSDSRLSSQWRHPAISSSVVPFSSCPKSLPPSESFPMSQLFAWDGQSTGVSALASYWHLLNPVSGNTFGALGCHVKSLTSLLERLHGETLRLPGG